MGVEHFEEGDYGPGCLAVESRGWFIEEEEELGARGELGGYREFFALFDVETLCC